MDALARLNRKGPASKACFKWIADLKDLMKPDSVYVCTGSHEEYEGLCRLLVETGTFTQLNPALRPNCYLARSSMDDVARVEDRTFICTRLKDDAGPTNNWTEPHEMRQTLRRLLDGCMLGRTMFIIPFSMGAIGGPISKVGIQVTDSPYVVVNMHIMSRVHHDILDMLDAVPNWVKCTHSVGYPLQKDHQHDVPWPSNPTKYICHFPEEMEIISFGSGYGGNALLSKKCFALRIASWLGRREGWLAEHCLLMGLEVKLNGGQVKKHYIAAGFPSQCGKTNLAMLVPTIADVKATCVGDDIAWMAVGKDGRLRGMNPETGFFGVAPGTSESSNNSAVEAIRSNTIFTNVALSDDTDVWWEGKTKEPPKHLIDWKGQNWTPEKKTPASHPNARYTAPLRQCPVLDSHANDPEGVPLSAIVYGGRRSDVIPLVVEAFDWAHGVFLASICSSETTAAAAGAVGVVRRDPFAMLPFCGYHMGDYFGHWLAVGSKLSPTPKIFYVNWFRKDERGKFMWPGFGDNSRVLKWIVERVEGKAKAVRTPLGYVPAEGALDTTGLNVSRDTMQKLTAFPHAAWVKEIPSIRAHYASFGNHLPAALWEQLKKLEVELGLAPASKL